MSHRQVFTRVAVGLICALASVAQADAQSYTRYEISLGGSSASPQAMNDSGEVVGSAMVPSGSHHAFLFSGGRTTDLGTFGGPGSHAQGINASGDVFGRAQTADGQWHPFLYRNGLMRRLTSDGYVTGSATKMNAKGQVIGTASNGTSSTAFIYTPNATGGSVKTLHMGGTYSYAADLSDTGFVVGYARNGAGNDRPFIYNSQNGDMRDVGTWGGPRGYSVAVNNNGQAVGYAADGSGAYRDFLYSYATGERIGMLHSYASSHSQDINERGEVIGTVASGQYSWAFVYSPGRWVTTISHGSYGSYARSLNERGEVFGEYNYSAYNNCYYDYWYGYYCYTSYLRRAFIWSNGSMRSLDAGGESYPVEMNERGEATVQLRESTDHVGFFSGSSLIGSPSSGPSYARKLNANGTWVGHAALAGGWRAVFGTAATPIRDLNELAGSPDANLTFAYDISDSGHISGTGDFNGVPKAFLLANTEAPPVAAFKVSGDLRAGLPVAFDGGDSYHLGGRSILKYEWDLGTGTFSAEGQTVTHAFAEPHTAVIRLRVTTDAGTTNIHAQQVVIREGTPPTITMSSLGTAPYRKGQSAAVTFTCTDTSGIVSCEGVSSMAGSTPVQSGGALDTTLAGTFDFVLTATDAAGNTATRSVSYTVADVVNLLVADPAQNRIIAYDAETLRFAGTFIHPGLGGLGTPGCILVHDGFLFVCDPSNFTILRYDAVSGSPAPSLGSPGAIFATSVANLGQYSGPLALRFGPDGNLYVATNYSGAVERYSGETGQPMPAIAGTRATFTKTRQNDGIDFGADGDLYVANFDPASVWQMNGSTGLFVKEFVPQGDSTIGSRADNLLWGPDGNLYVATRPANSPTSGGFIRRYDATGKALPVPGRSGADVVKLQTIPGGLAFGSDRYLYVSTWDYAGGIGLLQVDVVNGVVRTQIELPPGTSAAGLAFSHDVVTTRPLPVTSIDPATGSSSGGTTITIRGEGFAAGATVTVGGANASSVNVVDASTIIAVTPNHPAGGANVVVRNPDGSQGTLQNGFAFVDLPPVAAFSSELAPAGQVSTFDGSQSHHPGGRPIGSYRWSFGDGTPPAEGLRVSHVYTAPGSYLVVLTVTDDIGLSASAAATAEISDGTPPVIVPITGGTQHPTGWYTSDVTLSWNVNDAESTPSAGSNCAPLRITRDTPGTVLTCTASSAGGSATASVTVRRDTTGPVITSPLDGLTLERNAPAVFEWTCSDLLSGPALCESSAPKGGAIDTAVGPGGTFTVSAVDAVGNRAEKTVTYYVVPATNAFVWAKTTASPQPAARFGHGMVLDSKRNTMILIGGMNAGGYLNDVWEYDLAARVWRDVTPSATAPQPIPRHTFGMAYDEARDVVVVYAGRVASEYSNVNSTGDTWEWHPSTRSWHRVDTAGPIVVAGFIEPSLAWDPVGQRIILFGGKPYYGWPLNDITYTFNGTTWVALASAGPEARARAAMSTDTRRGRVVLHGGWNRNPQGNWWMLNDTWEWDGVRWERRASAEPAPPARMAGAMAYDASRGVTVLFGGTNNIFAQVLYGDTWEWNGGAWLRRPTTGALSARVTTMAYDPVGAQVIVLGGNGSSGLPQSGALPDVWTGKGYEVVPVQIMAAPASARLGESALVQATVMGISGPLASRRVQFDVEGDGQFDDGEVLTDAAGTAPFEISAAAIQQKLQRHTGTFTFAARHVADGLYAAGEASNSVTVTRGKATISLQGGTFTYDAQAHPATLAVAGVFGEAVGGVQLEHAPSLPRDAGSYAVTATFPGNADYEPATATTVVEITRATPTLRLRGGAFTYDGMPHPAQGTAVGVEGEILGDLTVSYAPGPAAPAQAGLYSVTASFAGGLNYDPGTATASIIISPAAPRLTISGGPFTYDGLAHPATVTVQGVLGEDLGPAGVTYRLLADEGSDQEPPATDVPPTHAGTYEVRAEFGGAQSYLAQSAVGRLIIERVAPTIQVIGDTAVFDGQPHPARAFALGVGGEDLGDVPVAYEGTGLAPVDAGTYHAVGTYPGSKNYRAAAGTAEVVITRAMPTLVAEGGTFTFDGVPHRGAARVMGVLAEDLGAVAMEYAPGGAGVPVNAGTYVLTATYAGSRNYESAAAGARVVIERAAPTVAVTGGAFGYDGRPHAASADVTGVGGERLGSGSISYEPGDGVPVNAGSYVATAIFAGSLNYLPASGSAPLVINRGGATVRVTGGTYLYDAEPHPAIGSVTGIDGEDLGRVTFSYNGASSTPVGAGTYSVVASFGGSTNYEPAEAISVVQITPAPLTIALVDSAKVYGQPNPTFAVTYTGFVGSDGPASLAGTLGFNTPATAESPVGNYPVAAVGVSSLNYAIQFHPGVMTVSRAQGAITLLSSSNPAGYLQSIALRAEVAPAPAGSGAATGTVEFRAGTTVLGTASVTNGAAVINVVLSPGTHTITAQYGGDTNVNPAGISIEQTVNSKSDSSSTDLRVRPNPSQLGELVTFDVTVSASGTTPTGQVDILDGDTVLVTLTLASGRATFATASLAGGSHTLTARYNGDATVPASSSTPVLQTVLTGSALERTSLRLSPRRSQAGAQIPVEVFVIGTGSAPTGSVALYVDGGLVGDLPLVATGRFDATAEMSVGPLTAGSHVITAVYSGTSTHSGSSGEVELRVK